MMIKTKSGREIKLPTPEENAAIEAAAATDPDCPILSDEEWAKITPRLTRGANPRALANDRQDELHLSADVVDYFRATGKGWQTRMDAALKEWIASRS